MVEVSLPVVTVVSLSPVSVLTEAAPVLLISAAQEAVRDGDVRNIGQRCDHLVNVLRAHRVGQGGRHQAGRVEGGEVQLHLEATVLGASTHLVLGESLRVHAGSTA